MIQKTSFKANLPCDNGCSFGGPPIRNSCMFLCYVLSYILSSYTGSDQVTSSRANTPLRSFQPGSAVSAHTSSLTVKAELHVSPEVPAPFSL